ncbi:hypothetical protein OYE22_04930 [Streptomyces sp. 71268]|nr:hypothetical protein [Streptomyces sp. 71268]WEV24616.1 hypothetical protein OYE22_04930 [Streptomyces sp. 71268]
MKLLNYVLRRWPQHEVRQVALQLIAMAIAVLALLTTLAIGLANAAN